MVLESLNSEKIFKFTCNSARLPGQSRTKGGQTQSMAADWADECAAANAEHNLYAENLEAVTAESGFATRRVSLPRITCSAAGPAS